MYPLCTVRTANTSCYITIRSLDIKSTHPMTNPFINTSTNHSANQPSSDGCNIVAHGMHLICCTHLPHTFHSIHPVCEWPMAHPQPPFHQETDTPRTQPGCPCQTAALLQPGCDCKDPALLLLVVVAVLLLLPAVACMPSCVLHASIALLGMSYHSSKLTHGLNTAAAPPPPPPSPHAAPNTARRHPQMQTLRMRANPALQLLLSHLPVCSYLQGCSCWKNL